MYYTLKCVPLAYNNFIFISTNILHSFLANMGLIEAIFLNTKDTLKASLCYQLNVEFLARGLLFSKLEENLGS